MDPDTVYHVAAWARVKNKRQRDLIAQAKISKGYMSLIWSGKRQPSPQAARRLAGALGVSFDALQHPPASFVARAHAALSSVPADKQPAVLDMLEGVAEKHKA